MEFESAQQAAERLGVTVRAVQKWAKDGKLPGAKQVGRSWLIPIDCTGPSAEAASQPQPKSYHTPMPLMNSSFQPGHCLEHIRSIEDEDDRAIAMAEYHYFSGQLEQASKDVEMYLNHPDFGLALSASIIYFLANRALGKSHLAHYGLERSRALFHTAVKDDSDPQLQAIAVYQQTNAAVLLRMPIKPAVPLEYVLRFLPNGMRLFGAYLIAHKAYLEQDYDRSLGMIDMALALSKKPYPLAQICLLLMSSANLISKKRIEEAKASFQRAWREAQPDDLIEMFAEHHSLLQGIAENCMRQQSPDDLKRILEITKVFNRSWRLTHENSDVLYPSDLLTPTEFIVAMLINRGWALQEIADHLELSIRMVKYHVSVIYQKLGITNREELRQYMAN